MQMGVDWKCDGENKKKPGRGHAADQPGRKF
jgi:hypothetical protein